jgi:hypothetical protein
MSNVHQNVVILAPEGRNLVGSVAMPFQFQQVLNGETLIKGFIGGEAAKDIPEHLATLNYLALIRKCALRKVQIMPDLACLWRVQEE